MEFDPARRVLEALERERVEYVVFGGIAVNVHGLARATQDLDIFNAPEAANVERLKRALQAVFGDPEIEEIRADDLLGDYPAVQDVPPEGDFHLDEMKKGTVRPKDRIDAAELRRRFRLEGD